MKSARTNKWFISLVKKLTKVKLGALILYDFECVFRYKTMDDKLNFIFDGVRSSMTTIY